jgi:hypothetical protein
VGATPQTPAQGTRCYVCQVALDTKGSNYHAAFGEYASATLRTSLQGHQSGRLSREWTLTAFEFIMIVR